MHPDKKKMTGVSITYIDEKTVRSGCDRDRRSFTLSAQMNALTKFRADACMPGDRPHTIYMCDVCAAPADGCGAGGGCMFERDCSTTFVCSSCVTEYCDIPFDERVCRYSSPTTVESAIHAFFVPTKLHYRTLARIAGVGCDVEAIALMLRFPGDVPFAHSVAFNHFVDELIEGDDSVTMHVVCRGSDGGCDEFGEVLVPRSAAGGMDIAPCWSCHRYVGRSVSVACPLCRLARCRREDVSRGRGRRREEEEEDIERSVARRAPQRTQVETSALGIIFYNEVYVSCLPSVHVSI
jgi:hypothetical protein